MSDPLNESLQEQERLILRHIAEGLSNRQIADEWHFY